MKTKFAAVVLWLAVLVFPVSTVFAQGTLFTYQGQLTNTNGPAHGTYNMTFQLWNASSGGTQAGTTITNNGIVITNGLFTVYLDFGNQYAGGTSYWLQLGVETNGGSGFASLTPRQELTPTPYAIYAEGANAAGLSGIIPIGSLTGTYSDPLDLNNPANIFIGNGSGLVGVNAAALNGLTAANFWQLTGNAGTSPGANYLGTPDNEALEFKVNGARAFLIQPDTLYGTANILGGPSAYVAPGSVGNFIGAGGQAGYATNAILPGGNINVIAGGWANTISNAYEGFIGGGYQNVVGASHAVVDGGELNTASGYDSVVPGGYNNNALGYYSFAGGYDAQANNTSSFVWADDSGGTFSDTGPDQFDIRASGGVGIGTIGGPEQALSVREGENIDQGNDNARFINNGSTNGYGLTFGSSSGEGIASARVDQGRGNQYGLDFYTDFALRMSIYQSGVVGIGLGTNAPISQLEVKGDIRTDGNPLEVYPGGSAFSSDGVEWGTPFTTAGINDEDGPFVCGYFGGALGALNPNVICLSWDASGDVWVSNNCSVATLTIRGGADLAEPFNITSRNGDNIPHGAVVVIDEQNPGHLRLSNLPYDTRVAGVVSGANGINPGIQMHQQGLVEGGQNVALSGRVYVQADASNGAISPGDMLTTSSTPGYAMKVTDHTRAAGAILGKAMTGLSEGKGMVLVLVTLQ
jgi:hypothetical protein